MSSVSGTVYVVDDDPSMRRALARLCRSHNLVVQAFASARDFLDHGAIQSPSCLVLDICMPGLSGLDLQAELAARKLRIPIVFITGHGDIPASVKAMKAGAVDFLTKPFSHQSLIAAIREAFAKDTRQKSDEGEREKIEQHLSTLTPRERQVFEMVVKGLLNKQIAAELGASEQTIKVHRGRVMEKMQVASVAELVQAAVKIGALGA
jgi:RNA polymerase sigma factor (sigma-70 family)